MGAQWLEGIGGLAAWLFILGVIIGIVELMRFLADHDGAGLAFRQLVLLVLASVVMLVLAGGGGMLLMRAA
jgi:hypothetical protein